MIGFASSAVSALNKSELSVTDENYTSLIHMDVDQNFLPLAWAIKASIFESFAIHNLIEPEADVYSAIEWLVKSSFGFHSDGFLC